jgi:adenosylhomocysteine nucleosidase
MKTNISKENTLIIVAMEQELSLKQAEGWRVLYSGIGKVNAIISATRAFREELPENVINFGTAGSSRDDLYGIHEVTTFKQRDMDLTDIGLPLGITLNDEIGHISFDRPGLSCGTGDSFVTSTQEMNTDLYDMEAYAIAKLCMIEKINFLCFKYISDQANETASNDWNQNISNAGEAFRKYLESLNG